MQRIEITSKAIEQGIIQGRRARSEALRGGLIAIKEMIVNTLYKKENKAEAIT